MAAPGIGCAASRHHQPGHHGNVGHQPEYLSPSEVSEAEEAADAAARVAALQRGAQEALARSAAEGEQRWAAERARVAWVKFKKAAKLPAITLGILVAATLFWLCRMPLLRWWYFTFWPHPAAPLVRSAIAGGTLDGGALADALGDLPVANQALRAVRLRQAETLFGELQTEALRRERELAERTRRQAERSAASARERAAYDAMLVAVAVAAEALERVKAAYDEAIRAREAHAL